MQKDTMNNLFLVDSNVWIPLFDRLDVHAKRATLIWDKIVKEKLEVVIPDCVVNETFSAIGRRLNEKGRRMEVKSTFDQMNHVLNPEKILWTYSYVRESFQEATNLMREHDGAFNFHDALIALVAKKEGLKYVLSFDRHFDLFPWIIRISEADQLEKSFKTKQIE